MEIIRQLTKIEIQQLEKINPQISTQIVKPPFDDNIRPIAPLVTAEYINGSIFFRVVVFIDSINTTTPIFGVADNQTDYYVQYNSPETVPTNYQAWYIEATYKPKFQVTTVTVYDDNADPRTSRGTVTVVSLVV